MVEYYVKFMIYRIKKAFRCKCGKHYKTAQGLRNHSVLQHPTLDISAMLQQQQQIVTTPPVMTPTKVTPLTPAQQQQLSALAPTMTITHHIPMSLAAAVQQQAAIQAAGGGTHAIITGWCSMSISCSSCM